MILKQSAALALTLTALVLAATSVAAGTVPDQAPPDAFHCPVGTPDWPSSVIPAAFDKAGGQPPPVTLHGLTVVVQFPDEAACVGPDQVDDFMNLEGFTGFQVGSGGMASNGSVRDYYRDVSGDRLTYSNATVDVIYTTTQTYAYWLDAPLTAIEDLAEEILVWLDQTVGYDFSVHDTNGDGRLDALNILTAGYYHANKALHPHASSANLGTYDGIVADRCQNTHLGDYGPQLAIVCHETGHMLFGWPDLYRPNPQSTNPNLGGYCLMSLVAGANPPHPNAYLKWKAGWALPWQLEPELASGFLRSDVNTMAYVARSSGPGPNEYFILENRQQTARDAGIADSGIAIYHVTETQDGFDIVLVEADGDYDLLDGGQADSGDLWSAPSSTHFDFATTPAALWSDGSPALLNVSEISANATTMTFVYTEYGTATLSVQPWPDAVDAPWTLIGPNGAALHNGTGYEDLVMPGDVMYRVVLEDVPLWTTPANSPLDQYVPAGGTTNFTFWYGVQMAPITGSGLSDTGSVVSTAVADFDGDGDDDIFVVNADTPNRLLRNDGYYAFTDVAPANLADAAIVGSAWADVDGDGDQDAFLFGPGGVNLLFANGGGATPTFSDVTAQAGALAGIGDVNSASWVDIDQDGALDLFLTRAAAPNLRLDGDVAAPYALVAGNAGFAAAGSSAVGAHWSDLNADGWPDLFICTSGPAGGSSNRLVLNNQGSLVHPSLMGFPYPVLENYSDCESGDFDGDGDTDLALVFSLYGATSVQVFLQDPSHAFVVGGSVSLRGHECRGIEVGDFDNDGDLDIYCAVVGGADIVGLNSAVYDPVSGNLPFEGAPLGFDWVSDDVTTVATLDVNGDGGLDAFIGRSGDNNAVMTNFIPGRGHWLELDLTGVSAHPDARAAKVRIHAGGTVQERDVETGGDGGQGSRIVHFGLAGATVVDSVLVTWAGGNTTSLADVAADQRVVFVEGGAKVRTGETPTVAAVFRGAYPNPFNPTTNVAFTLGRPMHVKAAIYGVDGRRIAQLADGPLAAGDHVLRWTGTDGGGRRMSSGLYFCRVDFEGDSHTVKLTLLK